jgi:succinyl-CoA synthetase alpha subunit
MTADAFRSRIVPNTYRDSVELMRIAAQVEGMPGIRRAGIVMATPANRAVLADAGLLDDAASAAGPNDLVISVVAEEAETAATAIEQAVALLAGSGPDEAATSTQPAAATIGEAVAELAGANIAMISTPGTYATAEALKALKRGLNVFLFSDNVPIDEEIELKRLARAKGLLVMGPDCGTAIIDGVPLGFANAVRRGPIGLVAASGTGLQQVTCLVDRFGSGVSQAIGVGGRDLDERVGGPMMLAGLERLAADPGTEVIVLISKPPAAPVARAVLDAVRSCPKPVVVNFLGGDAEDVRAAGAHPATTLEDAALAAVGALGIAFDGGDGDGGDGADPGLRAHAEAERLIPGQGRVRALYSGGTLASEAKLVLKGALRNGSGLEVLDLGDDEYTVGRPHPMIDPRLRNEMIVATAADPSIAVLLVDVVIGYGAHHDPAGAIVPAIEAARERAAEGGRHLVVVASVCGTEADPQRRSAQERRLAASGVVLGASNARAASLAALVANAAGEPAGTGA